MVHTLFSIVAPLADSGPVAVREDDLALARLPGVHFASVVVFDRPAGASEGEFPGYVVLELCADGSEDECLAALVCDTKPCGVTRRNAVADLFTGCEGFRAVSQHPRGTDAHRDALAEFLRERVVRPQLYHIGVPNLRLDHITAGAALRHALDDCLERIGRAGLPDQQALQLADRLRRLLRVPSSSKVHWHLDETTVATREYAWFSDPVIRWPARLRSWSRLLIVGVSALLLLGGIWRVGGGWTLLAALAGAGALFWLYWRWLPGEHPPPRPEPEALHALTEQEDRGLHNHMASLALLKPGWLRRIALRIVLHAFNLVYRTWFTDITPGRLQGLPTIHFAQWSIVRLPDRGASRRREALLFLSNYDGSWESYLDDFLEFLFVGVVMIWGNALTFPSPVTARRFKDWARTQMTPHRVWHDSAYPLLTVSNIHNNDQLRLGLLRLPATEHAARLWLARLGAIQSGREAFEEPSGRVPTEDMQGLLLRGYGRLHYAAFALLRLEDGRGGRQWLSGLVPSITDGRELDRRALALEREAVNVAFTHRGLGVLGLPGPVLGRFPLVFREGVAPFDPTGRRLTHRSRILGDVAESAPMRWDWGGAREGGTDAEHERTGTGTNPDVLLMMYGQTAEAIDRLVRRQMEAFADAGAGVVIDIIRSEPIGNPTERRALEHFGFVDGLSQPRIEGTWQAGTNEAGTGPSDIVKPGEFILGYEAADGAITQGVAVEAAYDPEELLPLATGSADFHDFGRDGTFLVARQLSQHVAAFRRFTAEAAGVAASCYDSRAAEHVAARIVGRWRTGVPLVAPVSAEDPNAFSFSADPHGFGCPIGAHIRRANPRDSLGVDAAAARALANRHRLLRRGRPYGPALPAGEVEDSGARRGMMFICLNADIERQFEFVQQNWINNPAFGRLYTERDPLVGVVESPAHFTVQANAVSTRIRGLSRFVDVVGGGYFFMPGMNALRYLASLDPAVHVRVPAPTGIPESATVQQSALGRALAMLLPWLGGARFVWAVRFPLLLAAALVILPFGARSLPMFLPPLFVTSRAGAVLIAFLASVAAWAVMVTLRLVLMYGTRVGLGRPRWTGSATWRQVFGFQLLALPVVIAVIHATAADLAGAGGGSYRGALVALSIAAAGGMMLGLVALALATAIQSLRPGGRPDLFMPPVGVVQAAVRKVRQTGIVQRVLRRVDSIGARITRSIPESVGAGYISRRDRRLLPGHGFAAALAGVVVAVYAVGFFVLNPAGGGAPIDVPPMAYLLFMLLAIGWILSAAAFFLDHYRLPTVLAAVVWLLAIAALLPADHEFEVGGPIEPAASPGEVAAAAEARRPGRTVIVASEGSGLAAGAWTAEVLTRLASGDQGPQFAAAVRLISASSGAALGAIHFADAFTEAGFAAQSGESLAAIRARASTPSSTEAWWGLAYPELLRAFVPPLVPSTVDRGWAMEQAWRRAFPDGRGPTLSEWRRDVAAGWRPAIVFGVTSVESGEQGLLATYRPPREDPDRVTRGRDVTLVTAARLSASFPYVSPPARPAGAPGAYHLTDGGFWDNSGLLAALEWMDEAGHPRGSVLLIEIRSSVHAREARPETNTWKLEVAGPLQTLVQVRYDGQRVRNAAAVEQFRRIQPFEHVVFDLQDTRIPLAWNLRRTDLRRIEAAWTHGINQQARERVRAFLSAP